MGQATYFHGRTGWERAEILHPHVDMAEELVDIRDIGGRLDDIVQRRASCRERGADILADLPELDARVTLADHVALGVPCELARHKDHPLPFDHDDMGIQDMAIHNTLGKPLRLDVLSVHGMPPSLAVASSVGRCSIEDMCRYGDWGDVAYPGASCRCLVPSCHV